MWYQVVSKCLVILSLKMGQGLSIRASYTNTVTNWASILFMLNLITLGGHHQISRCKSTLFSSSVVYVVTLCRCVNIPFLITFGPVVLASVVSSWLRYFIESLIQSWINVTWQEYWHDQFNRRNDRNSFLWVGKVTKQGCHILSTFISILYNLADIELHTCCLNICCPEVCWKPGRKQTG